MDVCTHTNGGLYIITRMLGGVSMGLVVRACGDVRYGDMGYGM